MELNIVTLLYLFFRLAPFIIVCYFALSSLFNQDMKGLIYLVGLLFACFITFLLGHTLPLSFTLGENDAFPGTAKMVAPVCNIITIGKDGSFSRLPLGITILSYTFFYLLFVIVKYKLELNNIPTLIFFPILILADFIWNVMNDCYSTFGIILSLFAGGLMGLVWSSVILRLNQPNLLFLNIGSSQSVCQRPSKQLFKCTFPTTTTKT
jgi:hypothetical protein